MSRVSEILRRAAEFVAALIFGAIVVTFGANIVARYVFSRPIIWADELVVVLLLWVTFLTAAFVTQEREQVIFDLVYERFGPRGRRVILITGSTLLVAILGAALPAISPTPRSSGASGPTCSSGAWTSSIRASSIFIVAFGRASSGADRKTAGEGLEPSSRRRRRP